MRKYFSGYSCIIHRYSIYCISMNNKTERRVVTCNRCGYAWVMTKTPGTCANQKCRSPYWNKERVLPVKKDKKDV